MVWFLVAESFLIQSIFLSPLTFDFEGYPRELVFHGRTSLRNVINHGLCKCTLKRDQLSSTAKFCGAEAKTVSAESDMGFLKPSKSALLQSKILCGGLNDLEYLTFR